MQETYEAKRNEFLGELQKKEEEMRQMFVQRVKEKEAELKEAEKEVNVSLGGRWEGKGCGALAWQGLCPESTVSRRLAASRQEWGTTSVALPWLPQRKL